MSKESDRNDLLLYTREKYGWVHNTHAAGSSLLSSARAACAGVGCVWHATHRRSIHTCMRADVPPTSPVMTACGGNADDATLMACTTAASQCCEPPAA